MKYTYITNITNSILSFLFTFDRKFIMPMIIRTIYQVISEYDQWNGDICRRVRSVWYWVDVNLWSTECQIRTICLIIVNSITNWSVCPNIGLSYYNILSHSQRTWLSYHSTLHGTLWFIYLGRRQVSGGGGGGGGSHNCPVQVCAEVKTQFCCPDQHLRPPFRVGPVPKTPFFRVGPVPKIMSSSPFVVSLPEHTPTAADHVDKKR